MTKPAKWAFWFFLLHTAADALSIAWMARQTGPDYGEQQLGIFAITNWTVDWWMLPMGAIAPMWALYKHLSALIEYTWPTQNALAGVVVLFFIPVGGVIYAALGWAAGKVFQKLQTKSS